MHITLDPPCCQGFLAALSRRAAPAFSVEMEGDTLSLSDVSPALAGWALAAGAFPVYEGLELKALIRQGFGFFDREERSVLLEKARAMAADDLYRGTEASGPGRQRRLGAMFARELEESGRLDLRGFCRFRLTGHRSFLRYVLECAASELIADEEEEELVRLLRDLSHPLPDSCEWELEFLPRGAFRLRSGNHEEGGKWRGREDALIADLLSRRPCKLLITGQAFAPPGLIPWLEQALGERMELLPGHALDKGPGKC